MRSFYEMLQLMEAGEPGLGDQTGQNAPGSEMPQAPEGEALEAESSPEGSEPKNYMFFSNLKIIKEKVDQMLSMDVAQVDAMISDGHDWASDHISTSRDDVEEVYNWLASNMEDQAPIQGEEMPEAPEEADQA